MDSYTSEGAGALKTKYVAGVLTFMRTDGATIQTINPVTGQVSFGTQALNVVKALRQRVTLAQWNAGVTLLAAPGASRAYRLLSASAVAYGGAATTLTTADIDGVQSTSSVKLVAFAAAQLTENSVVKDGETGGAVLAAGASYAVTDANSAITASITGTDMTVATGIDVLLTYIIEAV